MHVILGKLNTRGQGLNKKGPFCLFHIPPLAEYSFSSMHTSGHKKCIFGPGARGSSDKEC